MKKVSKINVKGDLKGAIIKAVDLIGGFNGFIQTGDVVLVKPNYNSTDPFPATTDIEFLKNVVEIIYRAGAKEVIIGESVECTLDTKKTLKKMGLFELEKMNPAPKILPFYDWTTKKIPNPKYIKKVSLSASLDRVDKIILLPCLKTHMCAEISASIKISFGFVKPMERIPIHLHDLSKKIAEINKLINPTLIIMDARKCFVTGGPYKGLTKSPDLILASDDRIAIDVEGIKIIQSFPGNNISKKDPWNITQIKTAAEFGLGARSEKEYKVING